MVLLFSSYFPWPTSEIRSHKARMSMGALLCRLDCSVLLRGPLLWRVPRPASSLLAACGNSGISPPFVQELMLPRQLSNRPLTPMSLEPCGHPQGDGQSFHWGKENSHAPQNIVSLTNCLFDFAKDKCSYYLLATQDTKKQFLLEIHLIVNSKKSILQ